jgi:hypothetical protein
LRRKKTSLPYGRRWASFTWVIPACRWTKHLTRFVGRGHLPSSPEPSCTCPPSGPRGFPLPQGTLATRNEKYPVYRCEFFQANCNGGPQSTRDTLIAPNQAGTPNAYFMVPPLAPAERHDSTGGGQNGLPSGPIRSAARLQSMVRRVRGLEHTWRTRHDFATGFALAAASFFRNTVKIVVELSRKLPLDLSNLLSWIRRIHLRSPSVVQAYKSQAARSRLHSMCLRFSSGAPRTAQLGKHPFQDAIGMTGRRRRDGPLERGLPPLRSIPWFVDCVRRPTVRGWTTAAQPIEPHPTTPRQRRQTVLRGPCRKSYSGQIQPSQRRDELLARDEPHVFFVRVAFALKGPDISAQGKATRVVRASPSPWVAYQRGEKALKGRDNRGIGLCRPFRASGPIRHHHPGRRYTLPRADLSLPLRDATPQPGRFRTLAGSPLPTASAVDTERTQRRRFAIAVRCERSPPGRPPFQFGRPMARMSLRPMLSPRRQCALFPSVDT